MALSSINVASGGGSKLLFSEVQIDDDASSSFAYDELSDPAFSDAISPRRAVPQPLKLDDLSADLVLYSFMFSGNVLMTVSWIHEGHCLILTLRNRFYRQYWVMQLATLP